MLSGLAIEQSNAQVYSNQHAGNSITDNSTIISDTTKKKQVTTDDKIAIVYYTTLDTAKKTIDTSIALLHRSRWLSIWQQDLGNTASVANSLYYSPSMNPAMQLGLRATTPYLWTWDSMKLYNTTRPYTDIYYRMGSKQDQQIDILHSQNIRPNWNVTARYAKVGSPGFYKLQRTNQDHFLINTHFISTNLRYDAKAAIIYNKMTQDENEGIVSTDYLLDSRYNDRRLVPVYGSLAEGTTNRSAVTNYYRNISIQLQHQYFIGKADSVWLADSSEQKYTFKPIIGIKHRLYTDFGYYRYKNLLPDSLETGLLEPNSDSLQVKYFVKQVGNAFSLTGDVHLQDKLLQAEAGYGIEIETPNNGSFKHTYLNNYIFAKINKEATKANEWQYDAALKLYFSGNALGNTWIKAQAGRNLSKQLGQLRVGTELVLQSPTYMQTHYENNFYTWDYNFKKQTTNKVYAQYINDTYHAGIDFNYYTVGNTIYFDVFKNKQEQYSGVIPVFQLKLNKQFHLNHFFLQNDIVLQKMTENPALSVPLFATRQVLSYQNFIIKKKLQIATGIEMRYNTKFRSYWYAPTQFGFGSNTFTSFSIQNSPQLSYFFNFKVKRYRASVSFDELQQLYTSNNINYPYYAAQNFAIRFGFSWVFIN